MRNKSISFLTFLTFVSCASNKNIDISNIQGLSILRKEQKIESLKNQIAFARNVRNSAQKNLENLKEELYNQEFSLIQKKLNKFKKLDAKLQKDKEPIHRDCKYCDNRGEISLDGKKIEKYLNYSRMMQ